MDQLKGKIVNVVLIVQEGRGLETSKSLVYISANFHGRVLESDPVPAEDCPVFNSNLVWEIDKKELRKIRSSNQPLRVECYGVDERNRRGEKFGQVLLDLRSAQILDDPELVNYKWHKLVAIRSKKRDCWPELCVSLSIRSHFEEEKLEVLEEPVRISEPLGVSSVPVKYLEDGFIKVGDSQDCDQNFSLNVLVKSASNLDLLLPEVLVFHQNKNKYSMSIKIFGIPIKTKQFSKDLHDVVAFEEKIVVRLLSNLQTLQEFFNEEKFEIGFYCGTDLLGVSIASFEGLAGPTTKITLPNCFFKFPSPNGIVPTSNDGKRKPSAALAISLITHRKLEIPQELKTVVDETAKSSGDHAVIPEDTVKELEKWKKAKRKEFERNLATIKEEEVSRSKSEWEKKKQELDDNLTRCKELQEDLQEKLAELKTAKALKKKNKSSTSLLEITEENQKKFADCEKELLIDYISKLQRDNENLKQVVNDQRQELDGIQKTALTKEQTTNLLQELKGLEEKFEVAQQTKTYFKQQWKKACEEIHELKNEDYKQLQDQIKEQREELSQLKLDTFFAEDRGKIMSF